MKLPVWQTYIDVFDYCWNERKAALKFGAVPFVAILALAFTLKALGFDQDKGLQHPAGAGQLALALLVAAVQAVVYLPMAVSWYRMVVFGDAQATQRPAFALGRLEGRLLWWQIIILAIVVVALLAVAALCGAIFFAAGLAGGNKTLGAVAAGIVGVPLFVVILASANRMAMALVLVAAEKPVSLRIAWDLTRGFSTRLFVLVILISLTGAVLIQGFKLIALLVGMIAAMAFNSTANAIVPYLALAGQDISGLIVFLAIATLFAMAYLKVQQLPQAAEAAAPSPA
jgi:hypothetical protein